ncbi:PrgI family protein [Streptomyces europaeiscabiei]|uniref:PrgI family protein n=1 Tax=Streptomyces europaeiscabiei TaxID=146819 RepID=UPI0029BFA2F9|nr:PrgI family protein [Streptomyces europaeiscabiei]MDX3867244.1 PrgI family protein [Streptomyces europaeiscabiei]
MTTHEVPKTLMVEGFRARRSFGFGGLSRNATIFAAAILTADGLIATQVPLSLLVTLPVTAAVFGLAAAKRHGMSALNYYWAKIAWKRAAKYDATSYRRLLLPHPYALDLPGVGASSTLIKAHDPTSGRPVGVVHDRATGYMTITTLLAPGGSLMAPTGAVQSSLRTWSSVLDAMSTDEQVKGASVTIQITPGAGEALGDDVAVRKDPNAPQLAKKIIDELVRTTPHATASVAPWMSVTVDPNATVNAPADLAEQVAEALRVVDSLDLSGTGTDIERRATDVDLRRIVRAAYDPDVFNARDKEFEELSWSECGPQAADDGWEEYAHDGGVSISWVLREMPRRPLPYSVLLPLLAPGRYQRRLTLSYRVLDPYEGEAVLEREISNAQDRARATAEVKGRAKYSQRADLQRAERAAAQVAGGSQVVDWTLMVTVTARRTADLPAARQELARAVKATRGIRMRSAFGAQAAVFAAGLPIGYSPLVK